MSITGSYTKAEILTGPQRWRRDLNETLIWLEKPLSRFVSVCRNDTDEIFSLLEDLTGLGHDCDVDGVALIMSYAMRMPAPRTREDRNRIRASCSRIVGKIRKLARGSNEFPGLVSMIVPLDMLREEFEKHYNQRN